MAGIGKAAANAHIQYGVRRPQQKLLRHLQAVIVQIFHGGHVQYGLKAALSLAAADAGAACNPGQGNFLAKMPVQKIQHFLQPFHIRRQVLCRQCQRLVIQKKEQQRPADVIPDIVFVAHRLLPRRFKGLLDPADNLLIPLLCPVQKLTGKAAVGYKGLHIPLMVYSSGAAGDKIRIKYKVADMAEGRPHHLIAVQRLAVEKQSVPFL